MTNLDQLFDKMYDLNESASEEGCESGLTIVDSDALWALKQEVQKLRHAKGAKDYDEAKLLAATLDGDKAAIRLIVDLEYDLNGTSPQYLQNNLSDAILHVVGEGMLTGASEAELVTYSAKTEIIGNKSGEDDSIINLSIDVTENQGSQTIEGKTREVSLTMTQIADVIGHAVKLVEGALRVSSDDACVDEIEGKLLQYGLIDKALIALGDA